jgi:hypothetical protein
MSLLPKHRNSSGSNISPQSRKVRKEFDFSLFAETAEREKIASRARITACGLCYVAQSEGSPASLERA